MPEEIQEKKENALSSGKVTKLLTQISILGLFAVAGVIVLLITGALGKFANNRGLVLFLAIFGFICLGAILATPWVRYLERGKYKIVAWVFTGFVLLCVILWIISSFVVNGMINRIVDKTLTLQYGVNTIKFVRVVLIISLQFVVANFIASYVIRYGKKMVIFQGVAYASYLYMDIWLTLLLCAVDLKPVDGSYEPILRTNITNIIFARLGWTSAILAFVWVIVANTIISNTNKKGELRGSDTGYDRYGRRRHRSLSNRIIGGIIDRAERRAEDEEIDAEESKANTQNETQEKLAQLKDMFDKGLIAKEEYDEKRSKLVDQL